MTKHALRVNWLILIFVPSFIWAQENILDNEEPTLADLIINEAFSKFDAGDTLDCVNLINQAAIAEPENYHILFNRAVINQIVGNLKASSEDLEIVIELQPDHVNAYYLKGIIDFELRQYKSAHTNFSKAIKLDPKTAILYRKRGTVNYILEDPTSAILDFNQAIALDPDDPITFFNRGISHKSRGDTRAAKEDFKKAEELGIEEIQPHSGD